MSKPNTKIESKHNVEELYKKLQTKSAVIRYLAADGLKRGEIAKLLGIRYQHVRNVLITPVKKVTPAS